MPSMQDKIDLVTWVEGIPARENLTGYEAVLGNCADRYGNTDAHLAMILDLYTEMFKQSVTQNIKSFGAANDGELPSPMDLHPMFDRALEAVLLRMWTYASEYYQRYRADDVFTPVTDDLLNQLLAQSKSDEEKKDD